MNPLVRLQSPCVVVLDTCAFVDILDDRQALDGFVAWWGRNPAIVYVQVLSFYEAMIVEEAERVGRLRTIAEVFATSRRRLRVAADANEAIALEGEKRQSCVVSQPAFELEALCRMSTKALETWAREFWRIAVPIMRNKEISFEGDRRILDNYRREFGAAFDVDAAVRLIEHAGALDATNFALNFVLRRAKAGVDAAQVAANPTRFPVATLVAHLFYRRTLANAAPREATNLALGVFRTKSANKGGVGTWYDDDIAATCAQADVLVTRDNDLRRKCEWLRDRGLLVFRTMSLSELCVNWRELSLET
jgi:hypothetical protein